MSFDPGLSVAAVLLSNGEKVFRTTQTKGQGRGPFCMMGTCFDCLVEIDGTPNQQACMTEAVNGMVVNRQPRETLLVERST